MTRGLGGDADHMDIVLDRLAHRFLRGLKQRTDIHVETDIGESRRNHLRAAIVTILTEFADQHARPTPL